MLSTRTTCSLKLLALAVAVAGLAVPPAQAKSTQSVPFITEHSAGQNGTGQPTATAAASASTRSYDPRAYVYGGASPAVASQIQAAGYGRPTPVGAVTAVGRGPSFSWSDAGVGAGVAFAAMLLAVGIATLILRPGRGRLAGF